MKWLDRWACRHLESKGWQVVDGESWHNGYTTLVAEWQQTAPTDPMPPALYYFSEAFKLAKFFL